MFCLTLKYYYLVFQRNFKVDCIFKYVSRVEASSKVYMTLNKSNVVWRCLHSYRQRYLSSQWSKCCGLTRRSRVSPQQILTTVMTNIVVDKSADNAKPHSLCFLPQYQRPRNFYINCQNFRALTDASSSV